MPIATLLCPSPRCAATHARTPAPRSPQDDVLIVNKLSVEVGEEFDIPGVLLVGSMNQTIVGRPYVADSLVRAVAEEQTKDAKVIVFKKKRRKKYRRKQGHRSKVTVLRIQEIVSPGI